MAKNVGKTTQNDEKIEAIWFGQFVLWIAFAQILVWQFVPLVCDFALVRIFGTQQTISLVFIPKILTNTKPPPQLLRL